MHQIWEGGVAVYLAHRLSQWGWNASGRAFSLDRAGQHLMVAAVWPLAAVLGVARAAYRLGTGR